MDQSVKTWQQGVKYTFATRHTWRHGNGAEAARINCEHFTRLRGASFPLKKITLPVIVQVGIEMEEEGASDAKINRVVSSVSTVLKHCESHGLLSSAPKFPRRKENEGRLFYFTKEEVQRLVNLSNEVFERPDLADVIQFAAYTGMRQGEIMKLRSMDVDLVGNRICVGGMKGVETKAKNCRVIPIHPSIESLVVKRAHSLDDRDKMFGDDWANRDQLLRAFRKPLRCLQKHEGYVFHTLRHSCATWMAEAGVPVHSIKEILGHKRIETTLRYAHCTSKALDLAISAI